MKYLASVAIPTSPCSAKWQSLGWHDSKNKAHQAVYDFRKHNNLDCFIVLPQNSNHSLYKGLAALGGKYD